VVATNYKGSRDVQVPPRRNPSGLANCFDDSLCFRMNLNMGLVPLERLFLNFPRNPRTPQLNVVCDLGIRFNVDSCWTSWTLDIDIVSEIMV
jgi:hypothetical protein